jgi:hypothetical protein
MFIILDFYGEELCPFKVLKKKGVKGGGHIRSFLNIIQFLVKVLK